LNDKTRTLLILLGGLAIGAGIGLVILYGLGLGLAGDGVTASSGGAVDSAAVDSPAPDFSLSSLDGRTIRLSELQGKPVLINFWATWCGPCIEEMPLIQEYYQRYPDRFTVLAINPDEPRADVQQFVDDYKLTFPVLFDQGGKVEQLYRLRGTPTSFWVDASGILQVQHIGPMSSEQLSGYLSELGVIQ
jgi:thiol-disulfide isomerase/thioredoxin